MKDTNVSRYRGPTKKSDDAKVLWWQKFSSTITNKIEVQYVNMMIHVKAFIFVLKLNSDTKNKKVHLEAVPKQIYRHNIKIGTCHIFNSDITIRNKFWDPGGCPWHPGFQFQTPRGQVIRFHIKVLWYILIKVYKY